MKSYYSIIKVVSNVLSNDSIGIGLILSNDKEFIIQFSSSKIKIARSLFGKNKKMLDHFIKQIEYKIEEVNQYYQLESGDLFKTPNTINTKYFNYLHRYSNNTIQFSEPKYIKEDVSQKAYQKLFELLIDKFPIENKEIIIDERWKVSQVNIRSKLIDRVKDKVHTEFKFSSQLLPNLYFNFSMDCIGKNGVFTGAKSINFNQSETTIQKELSNYFAFTDILTAQFGKYKADNQFYLISDEPSAISSKEHQLWEKVRNLMAFTSLHSEEAASVAQKIEEVKATTFI